MFSVALFQKLVHHVHPVITLTHVDWIRATCTPVPIVVGAERLMNYLLSQTQEVLQESEIEEIARLIAMYPRYKEKQLPVCPKCNRAMVLRVAKKGVFRGKKFYGCPNYPYCREICDDLDRCR
jgi:Topoisomerase DNA binding C4 zinc finger.